jgi:hypothetical protein
VAEIIHDYITGKYVTVDHLSGIQYSDVIERTLPLQWGMYLIMFVKACGFSMSASLFTSNVEGIVS